MTDNTSSIPTSITNIMNIHINGDRGQFVSKQAIIRFKNALRELAQKDGSIDNSLYFKNGWGYQIQSRDDVSITVDIVQLNKQKNSHDLLRDRLTVMKKSRVSQESVRAKMQKTVPRDIVDAYLDLKKRSRVPIMDPCVAVSKSDEYINHLREMTKSFGDLDNPYTSYHKLLFSHLNNIGHLQSLQKLATTS